MAQGLHLALRGLRAPVVESSPDLLRIWTPCLARGIKDEIVFSGKDGAANANILRGRQEDAARKLRNRYRDRLGQARGLTWFALWLRMQRDIHRAKRRVEDEIAPDRGLYLEG